MKLKRCGAADSKYFCNLDQFEKDIEDKKKEHEETKEKIANIILENPAKMNLRYRDAMDVLLYLKNKYDL